MRHLPGDAEVINELIYSLLLCNVELMAMRFCELAASRGENDIICFSSILEQSPVLNFFKKPANCVFY